MGKLVKFEVSELPDIMIVGKELRHNMEELMKGNNQIPVFWDTCFANGTFLALEKQSDYIYDYSYIGFMDDWDNTDGDFSYIVGMLMKTGADVPEGFASRTLGSTKVAIAWLQGKDAGDVCSNAHQLTEQSLKSEGYKCDNMKWCMELYNCPRFTTPNENGEIILDYYIPLDNGLLQN